MRTIFAMILGGALTVGGAYVHDTLYAAPVEGGPARTIVNWDVAGEVAGQAARAARREFNRLIGG